MKAGFLHGRRRWGWLLLAGAAAAAAAAWFSLRPVATADRHLVGAHYYAWYPENFRLGYLRGKLLPPQAPAPGLYASRDPRVAEQHIAACSRFGVDFLALDWWPNRPGQNAALAEGFLKARNLEDVRFCFFYETWALGFDQGLGTLRWDDEKIKRFVADWTALAQAYFKHPAYLRIRGRPVVALYLTRTFSGDFRKAIRELRRALRKLGPDPFIIGDEIFWQVTPVGEDDPPVAPLAAQPQVDRIRCFDAITAYNMYENGLPEHAGYGADSRFLADVAAKYAEYRLAAGRRVALVPGVIPGYNDRGVRPRAGHFAIPRPWAPGGAPASFLAEALRRLALPFADPHLNMVLITSWNEWNEDTGIEPLAPAAATRKDNSVPGDYYTQGYDYAGYGYAMLEAVRDAVVAVCGRVCDPAGRPLPGVPVTARQGPVAVAARSDTDGWYRIPRLRLQPGPCAVSVPGAAGPRGIDIPPLGAVTGIDFCAAAGLSP